MDFFEKQHQAKVHTRKLVLYFFLAVIIIIALLNAIGFYLINLSADHQTSLKDWPLSPISLGITVGTIGVILIGSMIRYFQVRGGGQAVAEMVAGRRVDMDTNDPAERRLINVVEEMSIASGMAVPAVYIMDNEPALNAFVAGYEPSDTVMVVTKGLMENLSRQELQGVVAHEFSHIFHSDTRINLRLIGILGGILAIGQLGYYILRSLRFSGGRSRSRSSGNNGGQVVLFLLAMSLALLVVGYVGVFFGRLIKAAISRQREYLADAAAVQYSRDSMGIANALYKIKTNGKHSLLDSSHAEDMSHMCFGQAIKIQAFSGMLATHPPIDDRIQALVPGYRSIRRQIDEGQIDEMSPIAQFAGSSGEATSPVPEKAVVPNSSDALVATIGTITPEQVSHATDIHSQLPPQYLENVRNPNSVSVAILALIAQANKVDWQQQEASLVPHLDAKSIAGVKELSQTHVTAAQRLPLVEIAIPSVKRLDAEQSKSLLTCASHLILADKTISSFEFFLYALLRKHLLATGQKKVKGKITSYRSVIDEIAYLISIIALSGNGYDPVTIGQLMASFTSDWNAPSQSPVFSAKELDQCLNRLNRLAPLLKKPLMLTLAEVVMSDGKVKTAELELLRATAIYLECPMPALAE